MEDTSSAIHRYYVRAGTKVSSVGAGLSELLQGFLRDIRLLGSWDDHEVNVYELRAGSDTQLRRDAEDIYNMVERRAIHPI